MPNQNEVALLRDQITEEVNRDAEVLGTQLFAGNANTREPDLARVSEEDLRTLYRQKYLDQDREWLTGEAQRDPHQFMRVAQAIGVVMPDQLPEHTAPPGNLPQGPVPSAPTAAPPMAPAAPGAPPAGIDPALAQAALQQMLAVQAGLTQQAPPVAPPGMIPQPQPMGPQPVIPQLPPQLPPA